jgi:hypothetical protein
LADLAERAQLADRLAEFACACLYLFEQPRVLDCNYRLIGKGGKQLDLLFGEWAHGVASFMRASTPEGGAEPLAAFRQGLGETGYLEKQNVTIEYRWAQGQYDRLPALAADLVRRKVTVIAATTTPAALAAKAATASIPIVFETAGDPITLGLVASLSRPGGNVTGVTQLSSELVSKRLGLLHDLIPTAKIIASLVDTQDPRAESRKILTATDAGCNAERCVYRRLSS